MDNVVSINEAKKQSRLILSKILTERIEKLLDEMVNEIMPKHQKGEVSYIDLMSLLGSAIGSYFITRFYIRTVTDPNNASHKVLQTNLTQCHSLKAVFMNGYNKITHTFTEAAMGKSTTEIKE